MEIEIQVGNRWKDHEAELARRIARVVASDDTAVEQKDSGYKWALDYRGNDWFMTEIEEGFVRVSYRYGQKEIMESLRNFLQWEVGITK